MSFSKQSVLTYLLKGPPSMGKHDLKQKLIRENPSYASPIPGRCSINYSELHSLWKNNWNNRF